MFRTTVRWLVLASLKGVCHTTDYRVACLRRRRHNTRCRKYGSGYGSGSARGRRNSTLLVTVSNTVAVHLTRMTLRETNMLATFRQDQVLRNAITRCGLMNVVNDGKPPSRANTVSGMNPWSRSRVQTAPSLSKWSDASRPPTLE